MSNMSDVGVRTRRSIHRLCHLRDLSYSGFLVGLILAVACRPVPPPETVPSPPPAHEHHAEHGQNDSADAHAEHRPNAEDDYAAVQRRYLRPDHPGHNDTLETDDHTLHVPTVSCKLRHFDDVCPEPYEGGAWNGVIPAAGSAAVNNILGMQTVHAVMLPSGKILLVSGSSWRNLAGIQAWMVRFDDEADAP